MDINECCNKLNIYFILNAKEKLSAQTEIKLVIFKKSKNVQLCNSIRDNRSGGYYKIIT